MTATDAASTGLAFVFARQLDGHGGADVVEVSEITPATTWVHVDYSEAGARPLLNQLGISERVVDTLTRSDTRPRAVRLDGGVVLMLRGVNMNPGADPEDMVSLRFWIEAERVVTVRQRKLFSVQDVKESLTAGHGPTSMLGIVVEIVERIADRIDDYVDRLELAIDGFETAVEGPDLGNIRTDVSQARRQIAQVRRYLAPQRDALESLCREAPQWMSEHIHELREQSDRMTRNVEDLDLARERALVLQEEILNRLAQEQNSRMYALSIVALVFLPITFVTGLFGMNVAGLPGTGDAKSFWIVAIAMAGASVAIIFWLRFKRWF